ncbi:MAG: metallophosphoesterase family protein [Phycisphaerae bacterium]|nr:metallophosphoesterase family protein [Phycisphaerae bacterium]
MSDSHGDAATTAKAIALLEGRGACAFFHCGDVCDDRVLDLLAGRNAYFVWGNCDHPGAATRRYVRSLGLPWPEVPVRVELAGREIRMFHGHEREFRTALDGESPRYIFHGHTHVYGERRVGAVRIINPGALHRAITKTVALLDLARDELVFLDLHGRAVT